MTDRKPIFRAEALEHRARLQVPGSLIKAGQRWTSWAFWALLSLVVLGIVAGSQIEIDRYALGTTATDSEGRVVVLVPAALAPEVAPGRPVTLDNTTATVVSSSTDLLYPSEVKKRYGIDVAVPSVPVLTSATAAQGDSGTARVLVESESLIVALIPGLKGLLGRGDG